MGKPSPLVVLSVMAMLNGSVAFALGVMTLLGSRVLFIASGYGPNRIAIAQLLGPFAEQAGWVLLLLGVLFVLCGYGLFTLQEWARVTVLVVFAVLAVLTLIAVGWGVIRGQGGVVVGGILKIIVESALCWYLSKSSVKSSFSG
jgi:hypothetical protein